MKCCDLTAGMLRHNITIERKARTPDAFGGSSIAWTPVKSVRAFIKPLSGGESSQARRLEAKTTHRVFLRYFADLLPADRVNYKGREYQIRAIINLEERNKWYELHCEEGVAQ